MCDDERLGKLLDPALVNILGFLASPAAAVKTKAMGILSHLNKRARVVAHSSIPPRLGILFLPA